MYNVSQAFITATRQPIQKHFLRGTVDGVTFAQSDVVAKSFKITNQLCENSKITLGGVYISKLEMTFATSYARSTVTRGKWQGKVIIPQIGLQVEGGSVEYIPAPAYSYIVREAKWTENGLSVIAYDNMSKFDKALNLNETSGKLFDFLSYSCSICGVGLGMTQAECESLCNGDFVFGLYPTDTVKTYRDLIAWIAQANATFALIGRDGNLYLKELPTQDEVDTINTGRRFTGAAFSDFETYYTGLSVVNIADNTTSYYNVLPDTGLTMNLGANPFLQYGAEAVKTEVRQRILARLAQFRATPYSAAMLTNPAYDLGDCLKFTGGIADDNYCVVMQYALDIDKLSVLGFGENPALISAQSKTDKDISGLKGQTQENKITYYTTANIAPFEVETGEDEQTITNIRFATLENTTVTMWHEYNLSVTLDDPDTPAVITAHYYIDGIEEAYTPTETVGEDGLHILGLQYYLRNVEAGAAHLWTVNLEIDGGTLEIEPNSARACLSGQGLIGADSFKGIIEATDTMPLFVVAAIACGTFTDSATVTTFADNTQSAADNIGLLPVGGSPVTDYIEDATGDTIDDAEGEPIEAADAVISSSIAAPLFTESVTITFEVDPSYSAYLTANADHGIYVGEDMSEGLFNTLPKEVE